MRHEIKHNSKTYYWRDGQYFGFENKKGDDLNMANIPKYVMVKMNAQVYGVAWVEFGREKSIKIPLTDEQVRTICEG